MASNKQGGIFSSMIGMLIGIGLVVALSPYLLWQAQSQDRAKEFSTATVVSADGNDSGYIVIEGVAKNVDQLVCPRIGDVRKTTPNNRVTNPASANDEEDYFAGLDVIDPVTTAEPTPTQVIEEAVTEPQNCLYVAATKEIFESREVEQCGELTKDQTLIKRIEDSCDEDGTNCEPCYLVNEYDWTLEDTNYDYARFSINAYTVSPEGGANFIGTSNFVDYVYDESKTSPIVGDIRYNFTYLPADQQILVAGNAANNEIEGAYDGKPFVISNKNYEGTLAALKSQDKAMGWLLRIASLLAMMIGMLMIVGPITYFTNIFRTIPILGKHVDKGFDGVIKSAAALIGLVLWLIIFALVLLLKNILIVIAVLSVLGAIAIYLVKNGKMKFKKQNIEA
ncbi:MAG: TMEM43 family protein [Patescibacteria group bacterium]